MEQVMFETSLLIFVIVFSKYSQGTLTRLPSNVMNGSVHGGRQNISSPQKTAQTIFDNSVHNETKRFGVRFYSSKLQKDLVIVMDGSESIGACEFKEGIKAVESIMKSCPERGRDYSCLFSAVIYSSTATEVFRSLPLTQATLKMKTIHYPGGGKNTSAGLDEANKILRTEARVRPFSKRNVLLVTDGQSDNTKATIASAKRLKNFPGVKVFVVAVGQYINGIDEMAKVATYPPELNLLRVEKLSDLNYVLDLALQKINPSKYIAVKPPKPLCS